LKKVSKKKLAKLAIKVSKTEKLAKIKTSISPFIAETYEGFKNTPKGTRTPVAWMRTKNPRPLDDGGKVRKCFVLNKLLKFLR
jgi:hypothetical protein